VALAEEVDTLRAASDSEAYAKAYIQHLYNLRFKMAAAKGKRDSNSSLTGFFRVATVDGRKVRPLGDAVLKRIEESAHLKEHD
jgi:hypothetical protein